MRWYSPAAALKMAISTDEELLSVCGKYNPDLGKLGVIEEGARADVLLVDGNSIENIKLIEDPARSFVVIMKDARIRICSASEQVAVWCYTDELSLKSILLTQTRSS